MEGIDLKISEMAKKVAEELGYKFVYLKWLYEDGNKVLRIAIDKKDGIGLLDITKFNEVFSPMIDEIEELQFPFVLDCSSPGAEREVDLSELDSDKDYFIGQYMEFDLKNGQQYLGTLTEINDDDYLLNYFEKSRKKKVTIKKEDVLKTQLRVKI